VHVTDGKNSMTAHLQRKKKKAQVVFANTIAQSQPAAVPLEVCHMRASTPRPPLLTDRRKVQFLTATCSSHWLLGKEDHE